VKIFISSFAKAAPGQALFPNVNGIKAKPDLDFPSGHLKYFDVGSNLSGINL